jgi:hypothetical protein
MAFLTTMGLVTGGLGSVNQFIQGGKMKRQASDMLAGIRDVELTNLAENLKPSLAAERTAIQGINQSMSNAVDVAGTMDAAQAMAMLGSAQGQAFDQQTKVFDSILQKESDFDVMRMEQEVKNRDILEARNMAKRQMAMGQMQAGAEMQSAAVKDFATTAVSAGVAQEAAQAEAGFTDPKALRLSKKASKFGVGKDKLTEVYNASGTAGLKQLVKDNRPDFKDGKFAQFFSGIGSKIGSLFN